MPRKTDYETEELEKRLESTKRELDDMREHNRQLSAAYLRLRVLIGDDAFKTPYAPTGRQVWDVTETALRKRLGGGVENAA